MKKFIRILSIASLIIVILALIATVIFLNVVINETKQISLDKEKILYQTRNINIFDNADNLVSMSNVSGQKIVDIETISDITKQAFISIEDKNFYNHNGINTKRMIKAMWNNIKAGKIVEGASTITQQLIKNTQLSNEKTFKRKIKEIYLAKKIEEKYSKDEILELYLNVIYFGNGCYGIEDASQRYFGITASKLTIDQSALLAGIIKSPAKYNPINEYESCIERRNLVLREMLKGGYISDEDYNKAIGTQTEILTSKNKDINEQYISATINEACEILHTTQQNVALNNYKIYTYLDNNLQATLSENIGNSNYYVENSYGNVPDGLGIIINNKNGGVEAFASNSQYDLSDVNRQPGSAIKPILVYAPALDEGIINPLTPILDESIDIDGYSPHNVGGDNHGYITVTESVAKSLNIPAVKTMQYVGLDKCKKFAQKAGIEFDDEDNGLAIALGGFTQGISLKELVTSYLPFARAGNYVKSGFIRKITTQNGLVLYEKDERGTDIMGSDTAYLMTEILQEGVKTGTSKRLSTLPFDVAGKTGTVAVKDTNYNTDAISVAYTTEHCVGITLFDYSNDISYYLDGSNNGGTYCSSILRDTLQSMYKDRILADFEVPDTVEKLQIDWSEFEEKHVVALATDSTPPKHIVEGYFSKQFEPTAISTKYDNPSVDFTVQLVDNKVMICAMLNEDFSYILLKNGDEIQNISNTNGEYVYSDYDIVDNQLYEYQFKITNNYTGITTDTNMLSVITKNKYDVLLDNEMVKSGVSWYFG